jgi:hypothetical protein
VSQTSDIDVFEIAPLDQYTSVLASAERGTPLHEKHGVYIQHVAVMTLPENFHERTVELFPGSYEHLRLFGLDPYDLALSKLERNSQKDRDGVKYIFKEFSLDRDTLEKRYREEWRPYMTNEKRYDLTMSLWMDMLGEE